MYAPFEKTYFDVRVTHPNCKTNIFKPLAQVYAEHEKAKKDAYEERVRESEKGSFIPLIFSTSGGMGPMTSVLVKRLSEKISDNSYEARSMVTNYIRTKIRFAILRSTLIALRGSPNQVLTHAARAAAKQLNFRHLWWPRAARAKGSG